MELRLVWFIVTLAEASRMFMWPVSTRIRTLISIRMALIIPMMKFYFRMSSTTRMRKLTV